MSPLGCKAHTTWLHRAMMNTACSVSFTPHSSDTKLCWMGWERWPYHSRGSHLQAWLTPWQQENQVYNCSMSKSEVWPYIPGWPWLPPGHQVHRTWKEMLLKEEGSSAVMMKQSQLQFPAAREGSASVELWKEGHLNCPAPKCNFRHDWVKLLWKPCP